MNKNIDINTLVSKLLTGEISEEEGKELLSRVEQDASLKDKIEHLMNEDDFSNATISTRALMPRKQKLHSKHLSNMQRNRKIGMMTKQLPSSGCDV